MSIATAIVPSVTLSLPSVSSAASISDSITSRRDNRQAETAAPSTALKRYTEYELRFVMPLALVEQRLDLGSFPSVQILQHYFSRNQIPALRRVAAEALGVPLKELADIEITSARVRRTDRRSPDGTDGPTSYTLDLKGPKGDLKRPGRAEISVPIERAQYERLLALADRGVLSKLRYTIEGAVSVPGIRGGATYPCKAEIDLLQSCGDFVGSSQPACERYNFATIDIEVDSPEAVRHVVAGRHSFAFLKDGALEFGALPEKIQDAFSTRRMAKDGVDDAVRKSLRKLHSHWDANRRA